MVNETHIIERNPRCVVCGRFMRRLKLLERIRLEVETGLIRTYICRKEPISYDDGLVEHE